MKIEFMKNGFQIDGNKFIAYQAIALINEIKIKDEYNGCYNVFLTKHTEEFAIKQVYFRIVLLDGSEIKITVDNYKSVYAYTEEKNKFKYCRRLKHGNSNHRYRPLYSGTVAYQR